MPQELLLSHRSICVIRTNKMQFILLIYLKNHRLHVSNRLTIHHQEIFYCICRLSYILAASTIRADAR